MNFKEFKALKEDFQKASVDNKINIYVNNDLTENQYKQLLKEFPLEHLSKLEEELNKD